MQIVLPSSHGFWTARELAEIAGISKEQIHYRHRQMCRRQLSEPISETFPLERNDAKRLLEFHAKRARPRRRSKVAPRIT